MNLEIPVRLLYPGLHQIPVYTCFFSFDLEFAIISGELVILHWIGSKINVSQMVSCVGQQVIIGMSVAYGFQDLSLPHFREYCYLTVVERSAEAHWLPISLHIDMI